MRAKPFLLILIILAAAGAAIGAGLNYALDDPEPEPAAQNNEFTFQLPAGFGQGGQLPSGVGGSGASPGADPTPPEPDDDGATAPDAPSDNSDDNDANGDNDDATQRPGRPQTPFGGLGGLGGGLVQGSVVDFDPPALILNTEAGSATYLLTDETVVSVQRPAAESGDALTAGANAFIVATFDDRRLLDAMMIVIGDLGADGGPLPPGSAFGNFALLDGEIRSADNGVIVLQRDQETFEIRYADDVTVSTQMTVDEALDHITPGVEVSVGAEPAADGAQLEAALIMIGDLEGFGLGGGFLRNVGTARPQRP